MGRTLVTALGVAGWALALWLTVRGWHSRRPLPLRSALAPGTPLPAALGPATARVTGAVAGAVVAGVLVLGLGGRLMMRLLAATSPEGVQGALTDAEEEVGRVTLGGTVGFVIFAGVFAAIGGLALYAGLRRWLPDRSAAAGLVAGATGAALLIRPSGLLDPDSTDFTLLRPRWLAVALILGLLVTFVVLAAILVDRWSAAWPPPQRSVAGVARMLPLAPLILVPPVVVAIVGCVLFTAWRATSPDRPPARGTLRAGRAVALLGAALGAAWVAASAADVLA